MNKKQIIIGFFIILAVVAIAGLLVYILLRAVTKEVKPASNLTASAAMSFDIPVAAANAAAATEQKPKQYLISTDEKGNLTNTTLECTDGNAVVNGNINVTGSGTINGNINVTGNGTINGNLPVSGDLKVGKNATISGELSMNGQFLRIGNGWMLDTSDGHLRFRYNGTQKMVIHQGGEFWAEKGGYLHDKISPNEHVAIRNTATNHTLDNRNGACNDNGWGVRVVCGGPGNNHHKWYFQR